MKYGKLDNGNLISDPHIITLTGSIIINPTIEHLKEAGYKEIQLTEKPNDDVIGKHYEASWSDNGEFIIQSWILVEDDPTKDSIEERINALEKSTHDITKSIEMGKKILVVNNV